MDDFVEEQGQSFVHDLQKTALNNRCNIGWIAGGLLLGRLGGVPGVVLVGAAGLLAAAISCKPLTDAASKHMTQSFLSERVLQQFESKLRQYAPVTREQSLALAKAALDAYPQPQAATPPIDFGSELQRLLRET